MSDWDEIDIENLTALSRIACDKNEKDLLKENLKKILKYVHQLNGIDTSNIASFEHFYVQKETPLREDIPKEPLGKEVFLQNAPDHVGGMVKVPTIIEKE